jgi:uncharacterized protein YidB (DUF937 family)
MDIQAAAVTAELSFHEFLFHPQPDHPTGVDMSLMNSVLGALGGALGGQQSQGANPLLQVAMSMLAGGGQGQGQGAGAGLGGLIEAFQRNGMGEQVQSWIGTGQNMPISGEQLQQALGGDQLGNIAQQLGMSQGDASSGLASLLPQLIDQLTPQGNVPQGGLDLGSLMKMLGGNR